ncbi:MAG: glycoside hydrolase family 43 protein [Defluviitaleaceae bacterium]|nr:glycoside hydrolase family 43 protein [Defluviitaleaceae bacterium]
MLPLASPGGGFDFNDPLPPDFTEVSVHDPSVFKSGEYFYIIGSHMAMARSKDLIAWEQIATYVQPDNPLIDPNDFADAFSWSQSNTFWAGDIQPMPGKRTADGRFLLYYCNCEGSKPLGDIGLAVADSPTGIYKNQGMFLKSGMEGISEDGTPYDATIHPNCIDPHCFFDNDGVYWMLYGSFSGGIFIMRMDPETGLPLPGQGYGKKLTGGNHARIEGPYMLYSPETQYYYLFLSFGGLGPTEGYNIRVARSRSVDGPFLDARGQDMINAKGAEGSMFDDRSIEPFGTKLMGGYWFMQEQGEPGRNTTGHLSPGHNSALFCPDTGRYFLIFHQRFAHARRIHQVRVHEMFLTEDGWFAVSPFRYDGGTRRTFEAAHVVGSWKLINHGQDINYTCTQSETVNFQADGTIHGRGVKGSWSLDADDQLIHIVIDNMGNCDFTRQYSGKLLRCHNADAGKWVMAFTAMSHDGIALWGAGLADGK